MWPVLLAQAIDGSSFTGESHARFDARFIPEEMVPAYFSAASAILIPYTESVGASGPIHSYAGYGVLIVAADVGYHLRESIGGNVLLFKTGDSKSLAKRLEESSRMIALRQGSARVRYPMLRKRTGAAQLTEQ